MFGKHVLLIGMIILSAVLVGCGDDAPSGGGTTTPLDMVNIGEIIENAVPPEYEAPSAMPAEIDSAWFSGQSPLLEKVFGAVEPQSIHSNIADFKMNSEIFNNTLLVDENGDVVTGVYIDSHLVDWWDGQIMMHFTVTVAALEDPITIPTEFQEVMGTEIDLDYLITPVIEEMPYGEVFIGMKITETEQTVFQYDVNSGDSEDTETRYRYASLNPTDSSFIFKGLGFVEHEGGEMYNYSFNITSEANSDFSYRMSYYSNGSYPITFLHTFLGYGNRDDEFAIKYRMFSPADTNVCDSIWMFDQVFGPDYSEGTGLITEYEDYLDDSLIFDFSTIPMEMLPNPYEE